MVITVISVATPIVSPSMVSDALSLCACSALTHCARLSRMASIGRQALSVTLPNPLGAGVRGDRTSWVVRHAGAGFSPSLLGVRRLDAAFSFALTGLLLCLR